MLASVRNATTQSPPAHFESGIGLPDPLAV